MSRQRGRCEGFAGNTILSFGLGRLRAGLQTAGLELWLIVIFLALLDLVLTFYGLRLGFVELNPIGQLGLSTLGPWSLVGVKGVALIVGGTTWAMLNQSRYLVQAVFIIIWGAATVGNAGLVLAASA